MSIFFVNFRPSDPFVNTKLAFQGCGSLN